MYWRLSVSYMDAVYLVRSSYVPRSGCEGRSPLLAEEVHPVSAARALFAHPTSLFSSHDLRLGSWPALQAF